MAFKYKITEEDFKKAAELFRSISDYKDAASQAEECTRQAETMAKVRQKQNEEIANSKSLDNANQFAKEVYDKKGFGCGAAYQKAVKIYTSLSGFQNADAEKEKLIAYCKQSHSYRAITIIIGILAIIADVILTLFLMAHEWEDESIAWLVFGLTIAIVPAVYGIMFLLFIKNRIKNFLLFCLE